MLQTNKSITIIFLKETTVCQKGAGLGYHSNYHRATFWLIGGGVAACVISIGLGTVGAPPWCAVVWWCEKLLLLGTVVARDDGNESFIAPPRPLSSDESCSAPPPPIGVYG